MTNVNTPFSALPVTVGSLTGAEIVALDQGGTTKQTTVRNLGSGIYTSNFPATVEYIIDGGGVAIGVGIKGYLVVPFDCTAKSATVLADQSGSITVDIWKCTTDAFNPPTTPSSANSITGSNIPTISSTTHYFSQALGTWVSSFAQGDVLAYKVTSAGGTIQRLTVSILCQRAVFST